MILGLINIFIHIVRVGEVAHRDRPKFHFWGIFPKMAKIGYFPKMPQNGQNWEISQIGKNGQKWGF